MENNIKTDDIINSKCIELLILLIKFLDNNTWGLIFEKVLLQKDVKLKCRLVKSGLVKNELVKDELYIDCLYRFFSRYVFNDKKFNNELKKLQYFLFYLHQTIEKAHGIALKEDNKHYIQRLITLILKEKIFLELYIEAKNKATVRFYNLDEVLEGNFKLHSRKIEEKNRHLNIITKNEDKEIIGQNTISTYLKADKFLSLYEAIGKTLSRKDKKYCPWCNPNKKLLKTESSKPPKCRKCNKISDFILESGLYKKKDLHDKIAKKKEGSTLETIKYHGRLLLEIIKNEVEPQLLNIDTKNEQKITQIKKDIKKYFHLE